MQGENEVNVRYALDRWGGRPGEGGGCRLALIPSDPLIGGPGLVGSTGAGSRAGQMLSEEEARFVQRFDPRDQIGDDTMGFFVAKFRKGDSLLRI